MILRILGVFLMIFSLTMIPPGLLALWYGDDSPAPFILTFLLTFATGFFLWIPYRRIHKDLKSRDGFLIVSLFWVVLSFYGALPFMIASAPHQTFTDAVFETVSGFTTTGSTVIVGIDHLPHAIRYYRQQLQFIGGMGIIVLAVAILPMLGIGGMQLYRAETPGPVKDSKLTPRIAETAKALWYIYVGLTLTCALAYWASGLTLFEAIGESFATVSTGGFSLHDASFAYYNNPLAEVIATIFMLLGATNFALHFFALQHLTLRHYWRDVELRAYIILLAISAVIILFTLTIYHYYPDSIRSIPRVIFDLVSLSTTTGYLSGPIASWPTFLPIFIFLIAIIGGCGGSTAGGVKVMRILLLKKQGSREINRLIHPNAVVAMKFGDHTLPAHVLDAVWGFLGIFIGLFLLMLLILMAAGLDLTSAFGALVACLANAGQGLGTTASSFASLNIFTKWVLIFAMLLGRLEIFTLLVLFTPTFWRN